jgi:hypothetical protein
MRPVPFGVAGTITMKMIKRTRRTSISGVTLISETALERPLPLPIAITTSAFTEN